ncbi:hypothetical protein GWK47_017025 [Chionoecetes opilio]|uniref:Uncharacterized protein n=1 Tax=Chionoecetes opilio TaxID=41210 RepID=A0A8J4XRM3_CHIOP|nr:hypothetical protein GWK47_017025 [Chionoecetes opilio]
MRGGAAGKRRAHYQAKQPFNDLRFLAIPSASLPVSFGDPRPPWNSIQIWEEGSGQGTDHTWRDGGRGREARKKVEAERRSSMVSGRSQPSAQAACDPAQRDVIRVTRDSRSDTPFTADLPAVCCPAPPRLVLSRQRKKLHGEYSSSKKGASAMEAQISKKKVLRYFSKTSSRGPGKMVLTMSPNPGGKRVPPAQGEPGLRGRMGASFPSLCSGTGNLFVWGKGRAFSARKQEEAAASSLWRSRVLAVVQLQHSVFPMKNTEHFGGRVLQGGETATKNRPPHMGATLDRTKLPARSGHTCD